MSRAGRNRDEGAAQQDRPVRPGQVEPLRPGKVKGKGHQDQDRRSHGGDEGLHRQRRGLARDIAVGDHQHAHPQGREQRQQGGPADGEEIGPQHDQHSGKGGQRCNPRLPPRRLAQNHCGEQRGDHRTGKGQRRCGGQRHDEDGGKKAHGGDGHRQTPHRLNLGQRHGKGAAPLPRDQQRCQPDSAQHIAQRGNGGRRPFAGHRLHHRIAQRQQRETGQSKQQTRTFRMAQTGTPEKATCPASRKWT